jgi:hypothetical protein
VRQATIALSRRRDCIQVVPREFSSERLGLSDGRMALLDPLHLVSITYGSHGPDYAPTSSSPGHGDCRCDYESPLILPVTSRFASSWAASSGHFSFLACLR